MKKSKHDEISFNPKTVFRGVYAYRFFLYFLIVSLLYGFLIWRINTLVTADPTDIELANAGQTTSPKISDEVVGKIESLQDNSVRVQTLFSEARDNPFGE